MLVLSRTVDEGIVIDDTLRITVIAIQTGRVELAIVGLPDQPAHVPYTYTSGEVVHWHGWSPDQPPLRAEYVRRLAAGTHQIRTLWGRDLVAVSDGAIRPLPCTGRGE